MRRRIVIGLALGAACLGGTGCASAPATRGGDASWGYLGWNNPPAKAQIGGLGPGEG